MSSRGSVSPRSIGGAKFGGEKLEGGIASEALCDTSAGGGAEDTAASPIGKVSLRSDDVLASV